MYRLALVIAVALACDPFGMSPSEDPSVTSRWTTPRPLWERFADVVNVKDFGAKGDGITDDTAAVAAAYAALPTNGGTLFFPAGAYKFNLAVTRNGVTIAGAGIGDANTGTGATKFHPAITSSPLITLGNGAALCRGITVRDVLLQGDGAAATGDGIRIVGVYDLTVDNVVLTTFGRDNLRIESSATQPSSVLTFNHFRSSYARGSCFRAEFGTQYVTAVYVSNFHLSGWGAAGATALYLDGVRAELSNGYIDVPGSAQGHVVLRHTGSKYAVLEAHGVTVDGAGTRVVVEFPTLASGSVLQNFVRGFTYRSITGKVRWSDAVEWDISSRGWFPDGSGNVGPDRGDTSYTVVPGYDAPVQRWATDLSANRTVTCSTKGALNGDTFRVVRTGLGAFTLDVCGVKTIPSATAAFVDVAYDGSEWRLTAYGAL